MGLGELVAILDKMFETCPSAFHESMPWMNRGHTIIDDGLMRLRFVLGPNVKGGMGYMFTGKQFYELCMSVVFTALRGGCGAWVGCFDIASLVPLEKEPEQKKRTDSRKASEKKDASRAWKRYPTEVEFCDEGVRNPDGVVEMFDIRGVMSNQTVRNKALWYVLDTLANEPIPLGTQVIFDFEEQGPVQVIRREGTSRNAVLRLNGWRHLFGEADQQMALWTWLFRASDVEIRSGDTDTLAVIGALVENATRATLASEKEPTREDLIAAIARVFPNKIMWSRGAMRGSSTTKARQSVKARSKRLIEAQAKGKRLEEKLPEAVRTHHHPIAIKDLVAALLQMGVSMKVVILILCHGMGSDYNEKNNLAAQTGVPNVWVHMLANKAKLDQLTWRPSSLLKRGRACVWARVLCGLDGVELIYNHNPKALGAWKEEDNDKEFDEACRVLIEFWDGVPRRQHGSSSRELQEFGALMCLWGTQYWMFPFDLITIDAPSPFATTEEWNETFC
jgi:hypothetical protein